MPRQRIIPLRSTPLSPKQKWTRPQQRFLQLLQNPENLHLSRTKLCQLAGYRDKSAWLSAIIDKHFVAAVEALGRPVSKKPSSDEWTPTQRKLLAALERGENPQQPIKDLCQRADVCYASWYRCIKDPHFVETVQALGVLVVRQWAEAHLEVSLTTDPEEELSKDVWDMRRLKADYPKHSQPSDFLVDFTWMVNSLLRQQVKDYFRQHLTRWKARTFRIQIQRLKPLLSRLPPEIHIGTLERQHLEKLLPSLTQKLGRSGSEYIHTAKAMFRYMATAAAWTGPRPPRFLIWDEEVPPRSKTLPRPIPPVVVDQLDALLEEAIGVMEVGQTPRILTPIMWNALLILRRTGMRYEDLAHLKVPDEHDRNGCLDQDSEGYWWIRLSYKISKMNKDHRIPTKLSDGVVATVRRQRELVKQVSDHYGEHYLFRTVQGLLTRGGFQTNLERLAPYLTFEGQPYCITPHQFRHTIATDMIEQGVDIYTLKEYLGHASIAMTEKYVQVYLKSLKKKFDAYRAKKGQTFAAEMLAKEVEVPHEDQEVDGGWVAGKVGKLYLSPLPDGIGNCAHLAMLDPCPTPPHCPTCPKLRASKRHLAVWENKATNLLITIEALRDNPTYARARQRHEQELRHTEHVIETIKQEGFWDGRLHNS